MLSGSCGLAEGRARRRPRPCMPQGARAPRKRDALEPAAAGQRALRFARRRRRGRRTGRSRTSTGLTKLSSAELNGQLAAAIAACERRGRAGGRGRGLASGSSGGPRRGGAPAWRCGARIRPVAARAGGTRREPDGIRVGRVKHGVCIAVDGHSLDLSFLRLRPP